MRDPLLTDNLVNHECDPSLVNNTSWRGTFRLGDLRQMAPKGSVLEFGAPVGADSASNDDDLILSVLPKAAGTDTNAANRVLVSTGNYVGEFVHEGKTIRIGSRFGWPFLKRMLNFADDVFLSDVDALPQQTSDETPIGRQILHYLFVQNLEKAHVLGLPKSYVTHTSSSVTHFRGRLDLPAYVRQAIPFRGALPSVYRELQEVQVIAGMLLRALQIVEKSRQPKRKKGHARTDDKNPPDPLVKHRQVMQHLREVNGSLRWDNALIPSAMQHKSLMNPIFAPYKRALEYAEMIIRSDTHEPSRAGQKRPHYHFLVNVAELFEIYVRKLLQRGLENWTVHTPNPLLYQDQFFARRIIPDIVLESDQHVAVFDTKYKRMNYSGRTQSGMGDLDRSDFFQIHTYMSYYNNPQAKTLLCGGLLYPLSGPPKAEDCSASWIGDSRVRFMVDGVHVHDPSPEAMQSDKTDTDLETSEKAFVCRIVNALTEPFQPISVPI